LMGPQHEREALPLDRTPGADQRRRVLGGLICEYERGRMKPRPEPVAEFWNPTGACPGDLDTVRPR
jgi:hypothetical protein